MSPESISPTNLQNAQLHQNKVNGKIMLFCFTNLSAEILLHNVSYSFCTEHHILVHFSQMLQSLKALKIMCTKADLLYQQKCR
jgi:hypothetical protein